MIKIIDLILNNPGIHFSEIQRQLEISPGNLAWHLEILNKYNVIKRKTVQNYVTFIPYYDQNPISNIDLNLQKSEVTLKILRKIKENPGIWNNKLAEQINMSRKATGYHIKKLVDLGLINVIRKGNIKKLHPNLEADYFNSDKDDINNEN